MATREFQLVPFLEFLIPVLVFMFFIILLALKFRIRLIKKILENRGFYVYNYNESLKQLLKETFMALLGSNVGGAGYKSKYFPKIEAKTLKNKSLLITQEKIPNFPYYQLVFVLKNPKIHFPSFKLSRNIAEPVSVPKEVLERDITDLYKITTNQQELVLANLQTYSMKKQYKRIVKEIFELDYDQKLQTMTILTNRFHVGIREVMDFALTLEEGMEDYKEPVISSEDISSINEGQEEPVKQIPNSLKIYNIVSLINTTKTKEKCVICWSKIDYSTETLLFECCSGYTHLDHGIDWIQEKEKCPKCGNPHPFTIQLPSLKLD